MHPTPGSSSPLCTWTCFWFHLAPGYTRLSLQGKGEVFALTPFRNRTWACSSPTEPSYLPGPALQEPPIVDGGRDCLVIQNRSWDCQPSILPTEDTDKSACIANTEGWAARFSLHPRGRWTAQCRHQETAPRRSKGSVCLLNFLFIYFFYLYDTYCVTLGNLVSGLHFLS